MPWTSAAGTKTWYNSPLVWLGIMVVIVGTGLASQKARHFYRDWKEKRFIEEARASFEAGDYRSAALKAQRALQLNVSNLEASSIMAQVLEEARARESILWRRRLTELNPDDPEQRLAWASSALSFGEASIAVQALATFTESSKNTAAYHSLAGSLAMAQGKVADAEAHYAEAAKLQPDKPKRKIELANVQLQSSDAKVRENAEATLRNFLGDENWRVQARRILTVDAARNGRVLKARELATELQADPKAAFSDRIVFLNLLHITSNPKFATTLQDLQERAKENPEELFDLISWMNSNKLALVAIDWINQLPKDVRSQPPVPLAVGESFATLSDWPGLQALTNGDTWGDMEFSRCALLSLAYRKQGDELNSKNQWINALRAAQKRPEAIVALARLSSAWGWENETRELLWQIANGTFPPEWVLRALQKTYTKEHDSRGLYRLLKRELALNPTNPQARNSVALMSLLLGENLENASKTAQELYTNNPENRVITVTYAFSLHLRKRNKEALDVMNQLKESLRDPDIAVYYALMLASAGETDKAREFFKLGETSDLLPEERAMVNQAQALLNAP
jgi:predicted Zn-dependent protease